MTSQQQHPIRPDEYGALVQRLGGKYECRGGQMFAMAGVSANHSRLQVNITLLISRHTVAIDLFRLDSGSWIFHPLRVEE